MISTLLFLAAIPLVLADDYSLTEVETHVEDSVVHRSLQGFSRAGSRNTILRRTRVLDGIDIDESYNCPDSATTLGGCGSAFCYQIDDIPCRKSVACPAGSTRSSSLDCSNLPVGRAFTCDCNSCDTTTSVSSNYHSGRNNGCTNMDSGCTGDRCSWIDILGDGKTVVGQYLSGSCQVKIDGKSCSCSVCGDKSVSYDCRAFSSDALASIGCGATSWIASAIELPPTPFPTNRPTPNPTGRPTLNPTPGPSPRPTPNPTDKPSLKPVSPPTPNPTENPVPNPTRSPVSQPTLAPTQEAVFAGDATLPPVSDPTSSPVNSPTDPPVSKPTESPVNSPTDPPVSKPTDSPVKSPTDPPVNSPTDSLVNSSTDSPTANPVAVTASPTETTTEPPTKGPVATWESRCNNMIFNSDMELGLEGYWRAAGAGEIANNMPGYESSIGIRSWARHRVWDGPEYVIHRGVYRGCVPSGSVWKLGAQFKLVDPVTNKGLNCLTNPPYDSPQDFRNGDDFCPKVTIYLRDSRQTLLTLRVGGYPNSWDPEGYNLFETTFTFPEPSGGWTGEVRNFRIVIDRMNPTADLLMDDFYFSRVA